MRTLLLTLFLLPAVCTACGGEGGGAAPRTMAGSWSVVGMAPREGSSTDVLVGSAHAGDGLVTLTLLRKRGSASAAPEETELTYRELPDGIVEWIDSGSGRTALRGGLGSDGEVLVMATGDALFAPLVLVLVRAGTVRDPAALHGLYRWCGAIDGGMRISGTGEYFPSPGGGGGDHGILRTTESINDHGTIDTRTLTMAGGAYDIAPEGTLEEEFPEPARYAGAVSADGNLVLTAGTLDSGTPRLFAHTRTGSGMDTADFSGSYHVVGLERIDATGEHASILGVLEADGAGAGTFEGRAVYGGNVEEFLSSTFVPNAVDADGTLRVTLAAADEMLGGLSPDGRCAILAGGLISPDGGFFVLIRR